MSIYNALRSGVSGLTANSSAMAVISDNIANVNTIGFKRGTTEFVSLLNGQSSGSNYNPGGVLSSTRRLVDQQGTVQASTSTTDLAIEGDGFFVVSTDSQPAAEAEVAFTRSGSFRVDRSGYLVNAQNFFLQGWPVQTDGSVDSSPTNLATLEAINVGDVIATAEQTTTVSLRANLDSQQLPRDPVADPTLAAYAVGSLADGTIAPHYQTSIEVYDSLGAPRTLNFAFLKTGPLTWQAEIYSSDVAAPGVVASGEIVFDSNGGVASIAQTLTTTPTPIIWNTNTGAGPQTVTFDLENTLSQFADEYSVSGVITDGVPPGDLAELRVERGGLLTATFTNGRSRALYQIPVATFLNPDALSPDRGGVFRTSIESGAFNLNNANAGGAGDIKSSALEASNVDLASEFTTMIVTQRAYSASSKIIMTADEMLEELLRIKR
jgi:flagellar hook protein FlgE